MAKLTNSHPLPPFPGSPELVLVLAFFFWNTLLLPQGLLYTTLLTPYFLLSLLMKGRFSALLWYLVISLPLSAYYIWSGAEPFAYFKSYLLFSSAVIFTIWGCFYLKAHLQKLPRYFNTVTTYNFFFTLLAIPVLMIPLIKGWMWHFDPIHPAIPIIPRLKMWVYEPSFYSLQLAPVFLYYFIAYLFDDQKDYRLGLGLLSLSLILSLSFGVLGGLAVAIAITLLIHISEVIRRPRILLFTAFSLLLLGFIVYISIQYFPDNPIVNRFEKVLEGDDTSANGRTWEAFLLAWEILRETNYFLGAGIGQVKVVGHDIIVEYYNYLGEWTEVVRIPNAMAETLATFGIIGACCRLFAEIGLFFYTRVFQNYYRTVLFIFVFIYQFTGSYLTNIYEYLIWVIVFLPVLPRFDKKGSIPNPYDE